ncbi:MAG TPA: YceI family protein [Thermoanaerobaculia bacterium]|jgi:hypothetical protein
MRRLALIAVLLWPAGTLFAASATLLRSTAPSRLVLEGSSNVTGWRCSGTAIDGRMAVAAPLERINDVIDRIEDGDIARWMANPSAARFPQPDLQLRVPVSALRCGNRQMERDMYRALRSAEYPMIEFRFTNLVGAVNHDIDARSYHATIAGVLSLAGASRTVTLQVSAERLARDRLRLRARLPLRMTDFRVTPPTALLGMVKAKDELVVEFELIMQAAAESQS